MSRQPVDFLRPAKQPAPGWVLLAIGIATLSAALWCEQHWVTQHRAETRADEEAQAAHLALQVPARPVEPTVAQRRWQQAQPELRRPWLPVLRAIESATVNPVFLLSMTIDPSRGIVKLDGEAPSFDHALAYVQLLDDGGALQPATLLSHDQSTDASGHGSVKFSVATRWVAR